MYPPKTQTAKELHIQDHTIHFMIKITHKYIDQHRYNVESNFALIKKLFGEFSTLVVAFIDN
jgi:hypothetical protein